MKHLVAIALTATLLAVTSATAQEVDPRIEAMVSELHAEGYTEFTLNDSIFTPPTLVAEQAAILLRLRLDPDTLAPTAASMALDTDGDGILSARERRKRIELVDASGQAILALSAINEVTNRIEQHMQQVSALALPLRGGGGAIGAGAGAGAGADAAAVLTQSIGGGGGMAHSNPDAIDAARDTARDAISDRVSDRR